MTKTRAIIVDLDGVILNNEYHINHPDAATNFNWETYSEWDQENCTVDRAMWTLIRQLGSTYNSSTYLFVTARPEMMREQTLRQLESLYNMNTTVTNLYMFPDKDADKAIGEDYREVQAEFKRKLTEQLQLGYDIVYAIDDQIENCEVFTKLGIPTLHVMSPVEETEDGEG